MLLVYAGVLSQSVNDIFEKDTPIVFLGLDLSGAKFIGDRERYGSESDIRTLMNSWNTLIETEKQKFNIAGMLGKDKVDYNIDITRNHNNELEISDMLTDKISDHIHLRKENIMEIVAGYDFEKATGIGLMLNVESFNKTNVEALVWFTFIDLASKEVMFTERLSEPPGGLGMRNYWANAVYGMITKVKKKEYEMWRKKYQHK